MRVKTNLSLIHQGLRVAVGGGFDHRQIFFRARDIETVKSRRPTNRGVRGSVEERVRVRRDIPEREFMNKLIPLRSRGVGEGGGGVLLTFNKVEVTSHDSVLRI